MAGPKLQKQENKTTLPPFIQQPKLKMTNNKIYLQDHQKYHQENQSHRYRKAIIPTLTFFTLISTKQISINIYQSKILKFIENGKQHFMVQTKILNQKQSIRALLAQSPHKKLKQFTFPFQYISSPVTQMFTSIEIPLNQYQKQQIIKQFIQKNIDYLQINNLFIIQHQNQSQFYGQQIPLTKYLSFSFNFDGKVHSSNFIILLDYLEILLNIQTQQQKPAQTVESQIQNDQNQQSIRKKSIKQGYSVSYQFLQENYIQFAVQFNISFQNNTINTIRYQQFSNPSIKTIENFNKIFKFLITCLQLKVPAIPIQKQNYQAMKLLILRTGTIKNSHSQSLDLLDSFNSKIATTDFTTFMTYLKSDYYSTPDLQAKIDFILDNWDLYRAQLEPSLETLQSLLEFKISTMKHYKLVYPSADRLMLKMRKINQFVGQPSKVVNIVTDDITDTLYNHFCDQLETKTQRHNPFYIKDQKTGLKRVLSDVIAEKIQYDKLPFQNIRWQDIYNRAKIYYQNIDQEQLQLNEKVQQSKIIKEDFMDNIESERLLDIECLSCCPFFYMDWNIWDPLVSKTPIELMGKITELDMETNKLKDCVCYLLNNQGGVILFDCAKKYRDYIPMGEYFNSKEQESMIQKIYAILQNISPKAQVGTNIEVSFVPIAKNPLLVGHSSKKLVSRTEHLFDRLYYQLEFIEGMFVTRIKVKPTTPWKVYYWNNLDRIVVPIKNKKSEFEPMKGPQIHQYIKEKFNKTYIPDQIDQFKRQELQFFAPPISCFHSGECIRPEPGAPLINKKSNAPNKKPEQAFQYMSLLISKKNDHQTIKERLRRKGIDCEIKNLYEMHNFKAALNSAGIFHNIRFDHLLSQMSYKKDYEFGGKYVMLVFVAGFLKLTDHSNRRYMAPDQFATLERYMDKYHPNQKLKYWSFKNQNGEIQFFLETEGRPSTVLMYYVLTQMGQKCIFKNPKNYDKLTPDDKTLRIKPIYPRVGQHQSQKLQLLIYEQTYSQEELQEWQKYLRQAANQDLPDFKNEPESPESPESPKLFLRIHSGKYNEKNSDLR